MKITRLEDKEREFLERLRDKEPRDGEHMTDAIWCNIASTVKPAMRAAGLDLEYSDATLIRFAEGKMWEARLTFGDWRKQLELSSPDDDSVGTVDAVLPRTWFPIEAKTTKGSTLASIPDATLLQLGGYAARLMIGHSFITVPASEATWKGEVRTLHKDGDCGKSKCLTHGYPEWPEGTAEKDKRRLNPDTNRQKLCCPECEEFLTSTHEPTVRFYEVEWSCDELLEIHKLLTWRLATLKEDRSGYRNLWIYNRSMGLNGDPLEELPLPDWKWGYPDIECKNCKVREVVGCEGHEEEKQEELEGSILEGATA